MRNFLQWVINCHTYIAETSVYILANSCPVWIHTNWFLVYFRQNEILFLISLRGRVGFRMSEWEKTHKIWSPVGNIFLLFRYLSGLEWQFIIGWYICTELQRKQTFPFFVEFWQQTDQTFENPYRNRSFVRNFLLYPVCPWNSDYISAEKIKFGWKAWLQIFFFCCFASKKRMTV